MIMAFMYFLVDAAVQFFTHLVVVHGIECFFFKVDNAMMIAANAMMNFAPMFSVPFTGARVRALQLDPVNGAPQKWAQNCFYMCTYAVAAQVLISIAVTLVLSGTAEPNPKVEGDMTFKVENKALGGVLSAGRYIGFRLGRDLMSSTWTSSGTRWVQLRNACELAVSIRGTSMRLSSLTGSRVSQKFRPFVLAVCL